MSDVNVRRYRRFKTMIGYNFDLLLSMTHYNDFSMIVVDRRQMPKKVVNTSCSM